jgi:hypothetical protein
VVLEVAESGSDVQGLVDGRCRASAVTQYLPVFESGDEVFDAGCDPAVNPPVLVGMMRLVLSRRGVVIVSTPR